MGTRSKIGVEELVLHTKAKVMQQKHTKPKQKQLARRPVVLATLRLGLDFPKKLRA